MAEMQASSADDIAIIGISCRFPGADNAEQYFQNLVDNKELVGDIPGERWDYASLYNKPDHNGQISSKWGGFISGVEEFDARFFKILPSEAELMDPQQKLFLTSCWESLEDAGYANRASTRGRSVGVYAGVTWNEYSLYANEYGYLNEDFKGAGSLYWGIPNRVSYFFDFNGPSIAIDTACSSSLVAIHLAVQELRSGGCEMALAGAVNLNLHPAKYQFLSGSNFLSSEGKCRGFGEGGDGYVPSEGVASIVLKPLLAAQADGDRIYGLVKATATNHGGKATGYTVPNPTAQGAVVKNALKHANINPRDISYVECHGTGTDLGDPIEIAGLRMAFESSSEDQNYCAIGTAKSNIGHCEAAAGMAGLVKVLLSMREGILPATLHAEQPNKKINFEKSPFYLLQENENWSEGIRLAGISSFGAGGSNGHCIVQSAPEPSAITDASSNELYNGYCLIPVSSTGPERSYAFCQKLRQFIKNGSVALADISHSLSRREPFKHRLVFLVDSIDSLSEQLDLYLDNSEVQRLFISSVEEQLGNAKELAAWASQWIESKAKYSDVPIGGFNGRLTSLPNYAFEPARSWMHEEPTLYKKPAALRSSIHPLIDDNSSTAAGGRFVKHLNVTEHYVSEHFVQDRPVLPGVCLIEMALFSAQHYFESDQIVLKDIWFVEPIAFTDQDTQSIQVRMSGPTADCRFEIVTSHDAIKHVSGKIQTHAVADRPAQIDLNAVRERCSTEVNREWIYQRFAQSGIVQMGRFKVVSEYRHSDSEAIAKLELINEGSQSPDYLAQPTLMDGAVQTAMVHLFTQFPDISTILPFQMGTVTRFRPLTSTVYAVASLIDLNAKRYKLSLCDTDGNVLIELQNFVLKNYIVNKNKSVPVLYSTVLESSPLPQRVESSANTVYAGVINSEACSVTDSKSLPLDWVQLPILEAQHPDHSENIVEQLAKTTDDTKRVVLFLDASDLSSDGQILEQQILQLSQTLFINLKALMRSDTTMDVLICVVGVSAATSALASACAGLCRCLNLETSRLRFRVMEAADFNLQEAAHVSQISNELYTSAPALHVVYKDDKRQFVSLGLVDAPAANDSTISPATWIITGAAGGLGRAVTKQRLARGEKVIMLGRSPLADSVRNELNGYGIENWHYLQTDISNEEQLVRAASYIKENCTGSVGLVHCAGTIQDGIFANKEWTAFSSVVQIKALSLLSLLRNLSGVKLTHLQLFSSITSAIGNRGQTDYAFANGFIDGIKDIARQYVSNEIAVSCINWPYWASGGMKISDDKLPAYAERFHSEPLPTEQGLEILDRVSANDLSNIVVTYFGGTPGGLIKELSLKELPGREPVVSDVAKNVSANGAKGDVANKDVIQNYLMTLFAQVLKLELTDDDLDLEFADLGVDSIAQMDLISQLEKEKRFDEIPQSVLMDNATISKLADYFHSNHATANYE